VPQPLDSRFPAPIQELWAELSVDVVWLHGRWIVYRQLFGTNKDRIDLLNETAGTVTWILQRLLLHDVQLALSKIGDPARAGKRRNLTLRRVQVELNDAGETAVATKMEPLLKVFEDACEKIRHRRNKWIAHNDLETKIGARATPLSGPSQEEIEQALAALRNAMNCVGLHYTETETAYEHFAMQTDGEHLITALAKAKRYRSLVSEGVIPRDDFRRNYPSGL
jgi:hypothetical protein